MKKGYPNRLLAHRILLDAIVCNDGPWSDHSRFAALSAQKIAEAAGMDREKAYVLALLHDIGRKFGQGHLMHVYHGYRSMMGQGYDAVARVCLTHSFPIQDFDVYIGFRDIPEYQQEELRQLLSEIEYDDYDRLVQLCDCLAGPEGIVDMEERMADVKHRYGSYPQEKWDANMQLKAYFEQKTGKDIYEILK